MRRSRKTGSYCWLFRWGIVLEIGILVLVTAYGQISSPQSTPDLVAFQPRVVARSFSPSFPESARPVERHRTVPATALSTGRQFLSAFAQGNTAQLWSLLYPATRLLWGDQAHFTAFYWAKFAGVKIQPASLSSLGVRDNWFDPRTQRAFPETVWIQVRQPILVPANRPAPAVDLYDHLWLVLAPDGNLWRVVHAGPVDLAAAVLVPALVPSRSFFVPILMYHHISSTPGSTPLQVNLTVDTATFAAQLAALRAAGYHGITLGDLFNALYYNLHLPTHPILLTFDDGYSDAYSDAFPALQKAGFPGTFFIITAFPGKTIGVNQYMTWSQIKAMDTAGMDIESHTVDHQDLSVTSAAVTRNEVRFSQATLQEQLGHPIQFFAYPSGDPFRVGTPAEQQRILGLLIEFHYIGAVLDNRVPSVTQLATQPYQLPRLRVFHGESASDLLKTLSKVMSIVQLRAMSK